MGTNTLDVTFADPALSTSAKDSIVSDLQRCVEFWGERTLLRFGNNEPFIGYADNPTLFPYYREGLKMPNDLVANQDGGVSFFVPANTVFVPSLFGITNGFELTDENAACSLFVNCVAKNKTTGQIQTYPIGYVNGEWRLFFGL